MDRTNRTCEPARPVSQAGYATNVAPAGSPACSPLAKGRSLALRSIWIKSYLFAMLFSECDDILCKRCIDIYQLILKHSKSVEPPLENCVEKFRE